MPQHPSAVEQDRPTKPSVPPIEWAAPRDIGSDDDGCAPATAAVLIHDTAEQRRLRDRACRLDGLR